MDKKQLAYKLNVSHTTIYKWVDRFAEFFTDGAKSRRREYTQADLDILATIAKLSADGLNYDAIERALQDGQRESFENTTLGTDTRMVPAAAVEQIIDSTELRTELATITAERDALREQLDELVERAARYEQERDASNKQVQELLKQIADMERELGRAETEAKILREQQGKRRGLFGRG